MQSNKLLIYKIRNYENEVKNIVIDNILLTDLSVIVESVLSGDINIDEFFEVPTNYNKSKKIKKSFKDKFNLFLSYYKQYKNSEEDLKRILRFFNISKSLVFLVCEKFEFLDSLLKQQFVDPCVALRDFKANSPLHSRGDDITPSKGCETFFLENQA